MVIDPTTILLSESKQALFAAIVSSSENPIISKTLDGIITSWNPAAHRLFGYSENEAIGNQISIIIPEDRLAEEEFILEEIRSGKPFDRFETVRKTKDGRSIPVSLTISPVKTSEGRIIGASKIIRDISEQNKIVEKQAILAAIVDNSDDAIVSKSLRGMITSWNKAAEKMFGYREAEVLGKHISLIIPADRLEEEDYIIGEIIKGNKVAHFETIRISKEGKEIPISLTISPLLNESGVIIGASKIARDISEKISSQKEKEQLYRKIKVLSRKKDAFIAMAAHELKTPVTSLSGFLQLLQKQISPDDKNSDLVQRCINRVEKLTMLVNDLLDISRIQGGKLQLRIEPFDIVALTEEVIVPYRHITTHQIEINAPESVRIMGDRMRIEQVLANLIGNAIKYAPKGGTIGIEIAQDKENVFISVSDEGIGISPMHLAGLFTPFYRVADPENRVSGLGMGLYISKEIVERHGGTIDVTSQSGRGSVFKFILPKQTASEKENCDS